ncbi:PAS domain S-box protein [Desulfosporosinus meridiei]|uniref:histidine kinase n=1 Tax=Desulfosporosinus meridiei (strain ATCC BAA-275 / DSM 13257 / KCTC 12902 / NCIMB 13706 / S10) TaxID=768704 RepID=J7IWQ4_DESMD|nr:PAS domain S-box protein [Desulfosporosinus meridiei]AFQ46160.1 PAS domain S-box [Desulfosporosinus meridiei DSM 13257]
MVQITRVQRNLVFTEHQEEFSKYKVISNFSRLRILATVLLVLDILFFFTDYSNYKEGLWISTPGYEWLFYSHVALGLGMIIISGLYWRTNLNSVEDVRPVHNTYEILFAVFCLVISAVITGWIDQMLHGQLTVYIIVCFIVAVFFNLSPKVSFLVYFLSYIIVILGIQRYQPNSLILNGHYLNTLLLIFVSWVLSLTLYNAKVKDFLHKNHLERLVKERTKEMENTNQRLMLEMAERKQIESKIFRLASIVESTEDGIIGMDLDGVIIDWNRGAGCIYGYSEEEIVGQSVRKLFPPDNKSELDNILLTISQGKAVSHYESIRQRKDGSIINVYLTVSPIKDDQQRIIGASTIVKDVTAQKKIEKEMTRMDQMSLVGEMAASIGHEIRNPMTTVRGFLQLLGEDGNSSKYSNYIPLMISELDRANQIISEFLSISRSKVTEVAVHNLNNIIKSILPLVQVDAIRNDKGVITELEEIPDLILDEKEMRQMILNLARNGLEAMDHGGVLSIKTLMSNSEVILSIQDQGTGIKPEIMDKLGTPFYTTKETGTGLGLAVCYGIAARHNAMITIQTCPTGSTFFVRFTVPISNN